jgi:hypothetical protein
MSEYMRCEWQVNPPDLERHPDLTESAQRHVDHKPENMGECDCWICACGNTVNTNGFFPCDATGKLVDPTPDEWPDDLVLCDACGRIAKQQTGEVVGQRKEWID